MGSSGKKKTTMAKHAREARLRERRLNKQARKEARRQASSEQARPPEGTLDATAENAQPPHEQVALDAEEEQATREHGPPGHDMRSDKAGEPLVPTPTADAGELEAKHESASAGDPERPEKAGASAKDHSLRRLREASDEELALFEGTLRQDALAEGATELELRDAQSEHPGHC
jgi:hypothetical protein